MKAGCLPCKYILTDQFLGTNSLFHYSGLGKIDKIVWTLSLTLGGSKAAFEFTIILILIPSSLYMFKIYFIAILHHNNKSKGNGEYYFTVLLMKFMQFLVVNVKSKIILIN